MYQLEDKITWDLLAKSLQDRFIAITNKIQTSDTMDADNKVNTNHNMDLSKLNEKEIEKLKTYFDSLVDKIEQKIKDLSILPPGTGEGMKYAYDTGSYGQLLKLDKKYQRAVPSEDFYDVGYIIKPGETYDSVVASVPQQEFMYDINNGVVYRTAGSNSYSVAATIDDPANTTGMYLKVQLARIFIYESYTHHLYYFYEPNKYVRIL